MKAPCKGCESRSFLCHEVCEKYQKFNAQQIMLRKQRLKEYEIARYSNQATIRNPIAQR